jgi:thiol-disulfide isomerase/thioredoxin
MDSRSAGLLLALVLMATSACGDGDARPDEVGPLPRTTPAGMEAVLALTEQPVVLNVWGSWCIPCRSEAPLLRAAAARHGDRVRFIGVAVEDREADAAAFIAEFGLTAIDHYLDPPGDVPAHLGGFGVPLTFFFAPGGDLVDLHRGIIDERTLALQIDELLRREAGDPSTGGG